MLEYLARVGQSLLNLQWNSSFTIERYSNEKVNISLSMISVWTKYVEAWLCGNGKTDLFNYTLRKFITKSVDNGNEIKVR